MRLIAPNALFSALERLDPAISGNSEIPAIDATQKVLERIRGHLVTVRRSAFR